MTCKEMKTPQAIMLVVLTLICLPASAGDRERAELMNAVSQIRSKERVLQEQSLEKSEVELASARRVQEVRQWALSRFDLSQRDELLRKMDNDQNALQAKSDAANKQWEKSRSRRDAAKMREAESMAKRLRARFKSTLVRRQRFRDLIEGSTRSTATRTAIRSGRAMNLILDACGTTALDHALVKDEVAQQVADLEANFSVGDIEAARKLEDLKEYQKLVNELKTGRRLTPEVAAKLRFEKGEIGPKYLFSNSPDGGALPLNWPTVIQVSDLYKPDRLSIQNARNQALVEIESDGAMSSQAQKDIMNSIATLERRFRDHFSRYCKSGNMTGIKTTQMNAAYNFVDRLRDSVYHFIQARSMSDVRLDEPFIEGDAHDLLAYMSRNGLRFAASDPTSEHAYRLVFLDLVDYHVKLEDLNRSVEYANDDVESWESRVASLTKDLDENQNASFKDLTAMLAGEPGVSPWSAFALLFAGSR